MKNEVRLGSEDHVNAMITNAVSMRNNTNKYLQWNLSVFPIKENKKILDLGCGPGFYFGEIVRHKPALYFAVDYSDSFLEEFKKLSNEMSNCVIKKLDLTDDDVSNCMKGCCFDYVLCFDVLEHIKDDRKALMNVHKIINETGNGTLFLRVPALKLIYGENDRAIGHYRRYSKRSLKKLLEGCGFNIETIRYQNIAGILPWVFIGKIMRRSLAVSSSEGRFFNYIVPVIRRIEKVFTPPIGLSLYCICKIKT